MISSFKEHGLILIDSFISEIEEAEIISHINPSTKKSGQIRSNIKRYGSSLPYKNQIESSEIPKYLEKISQKIVDQGYLTNKPNSISINEYFTGNAIAPHIDSLSSGPIITILSLLSDAVMVFTKDQMTFSMKAPRFSLLQLKDDIRYKWKHSILPVDKQRYSIVFREGL